MAPQSAGILHGGSFAAPAETAALAAQIHARETPPGKQAYAVGTELNARTSRPDAAHDRHGHGRAITFSTAPPWEIRDEADRLIPIARAANCILVAPTH